MINNCKNCGGKLYFSPRDKGNKCLNCGTVFPIEYNYKFNKREFSESFQLDNDPLQNEIKSVKCSACGANMVLNKLAIQATCPYCGSTSVEESKAKNLMQIDSIIPFAFTKMEALKKFKKAVNTKFYANKKIFAGITMDNVQGAYVNAFVFDYETVSTYTGTVSEEKTFKNKDGETVSKTIYKNINGTLNKTFKNLTIEANSNFEQAQLVSIMPYDYTMSVEFKKDFITGHILEYKNEMFKDCVSRAERIMENAIKNELASNYGGTIVNLNLNVSYPYKKYNYCLLPVYFFTKEYKNKRYTVVVNGQTGKLGKLPKSGWRIFFTILLGALLICGLGFLIAFLIK